MGMHIVNVIMFRVVALFGYSNEQKFLGPYIGEANIFIMEL